MAKRRRRKSHTKKHFLSNPKSKATRRRFRRNPRVPGASLFNNAIVPGAIGAAGALGVDVLMASVPMPYQLRQGMFVPLVKIGVSLLVGAAVGALTNREAGEEAAAGGIIVTLYGVARGFVATRLPSVPLNRYVPMARVPSGTRTMRRYIPLAGSTPPSFGGRGQQNMGRMGYLSPARISGPSRAQARFLAQ